jgi:hypothetical protein
MSEAGPGPPLRSGLLGADGYTHAIAAELLASLCGTPGSALLLGLPFDPTDQRACPRCVRAITGGDADRGEAD